MCLSILLQQIKGDVKEHLASTTYFIAVEINANINTRHKQWEGRRMPQANCHSLFIMPIYREQSLHVGFRMFIEYSSMIGIFRAQIQRMRLEHHLVDCIEPVRIYIFSFYPSC